MRRRRPKLPDATQLVLSLVNFQRIVNRHGIRSQNAEEAYEDVQYELTLWLWERDDVRSQPEDQHG